MHIFHKLCTKI